MSSRPMQVNLWWMSVCIVLLIAAGPLLALLLQLFYRFGGDFVPCVDSLREGLYLNRQSVGDRLWHSLLIVER